MIRSTYIKILADSCGVVTDDEVNGKIAQHCEIKLRRLLDAAQKYHQALPRRQFTTDDFNNVLESQSTKPITTFPRYNPLTVTYTSMSAAINPTFPIGYVFAANTTSNLSSPPTSISNLNTSDLAGQSPAPNTSAVRVRDVLFAQDRLVSTLSLLKRAQSYTLSPKMSLHLHYSSVCYVQPVCLENPTKEQITVLLASAMWAPKTALPRTTPQSLISFETNKQLIVQQRHQQLSQLTYVQGKPGALTRIHQSSPSPTSPTCPDSNTLTNQHKINQFSERDLLQKIPIPAGSQIVLLKQESILSLSSEENALLRSIISTISSTTTERLNFPITHFSPALPLSEFNSPYFKPTSGNPTITTPPLFELNTFLTSLIPIFAIPFHQHATFINIVKSNHLNNLLPKIFNHLASQVSTLQSLDHIMTQLRFIFALLSNPSLNFEPYLAQILSTLVPLLVSKQISPLSKPVEYFLHDYYSTLHTHYTHNTGKFSIISAVIRGIPALQNSPQTDPSQPPQQNTSTSTFDQLFDASMTASSATPAAPNVVSTPSIQNTPLCQTISAAQLPPQFIHALPEPRVRQFAAILIHQLIKRFSHTYPSIQTRITNLIYSLLSNFQLTHSTAQTPHPALKFTNTPSNHSTHILGPDDEVDLITSTQTAVLYQQQQQYYNSFNYYNPTATTLVSTQFTTNVAPISHYSSLLYIQQFSPQTIFDHYSAAFPTLYKYYFQLLHIPVPSWIPFAPRRTFTSPSQYIIDLSALNPSSPSHSHNNSQSTPLSSTYTLQHLHHATLTLHLLHSLIKSACSQVISNQPQINSLFNRIQTNHLAEEEHNIVWIAKQRFDDRARETKDFRTQAQFVHPADLSYDQRHPIPQMKQHKRSQDALRDAQLTTSKPLQLKSLFRKKFSTPSQTQSVTKPHPDTAKMTFQDIFNDPDGESTRHNSQLTHQFTEPCIINTTQAIKYTPLTSIPNQLSNSQSSPYSNLFDILPNTAVLPDLLSAFSFSALSQPF